ncbi:MAG: rhomboid family intramembrane serine protease [Pseudomonadota bacterium]
MGRMGSWWQNARATAEGQIILTYGFLHGGPGHMAVNVLTPWSLGRAVTDRVGIRGFAILCCALILAGAAASGLIAETFQPMVGASGPLCGLAGGLLAWNYVDRFTFREGLWPVARSCIFSVGHERGVVVREGQPNSPGRRI